jgi:eukaryotic-like serine/threonine-protein kinase
MKDTVGEADTLSPAAAGVVPGAGSERYGHYALGAVLGRGGMGEVMSATDERIGRPVAIKRMRGSDPQSIARFIREAKIQARLDHPAIVPVHEIGQDPDGKPMIVMKQLRGTTLAELLRRLDDGDVTLAARFTRQRLLRAFADVCLAVEFAHSRGVVHRDIKPANITLGEFGEVYVLDWGIAKVQDDSDLPASGSAHVEAGATVAGTILGTPGYMAPEQARGDEVDERTDVYALGCVLFEILTGQPLDRPGQPTRAGTEAGRPSTRANRDIAPELDEACVRATDPSPAARFSTARELGAAVERFLDGDRDIEQRKRLAAAAYNEAVSALSRASGDDERRDAMRAASRALALEPASRDAAALVARLMLEPPRQVPHEVESELERQEITAIHDQGRRAALTAVGLTLGFLPFLYWAGVRDPMLIALTVATCAFFGFPRVAIVRNGRIHRGMLALVMIGITGTVAALSYATPALFAFPVAVLSTSRLTAQHRLVPAWIVVAMMTLAVALPPVLGLAGWIPGTIDIDGHDVRLHLLADHLDPVGLMSWLLFIPGLLVAAVAATRNATEPLRDARRTTLLHSWWLRQLVPAPVTTDAPPAPAR